jgi:hypothetical protein
MRIYALKKTRESSINETVVSFTLVKRSKVWWWLVIVDKNVKQVNNGVGRGVRTPVIETFDENANESPT